MKILILIILFICFCFTNTNKIITISPAGFKGYYCLGVASYIKNNYNLDDCVFSGASAGSWISLVMSYKNNHNKLINDLDIFSNKITDANSFQHFLKKNILKMCNCNDFLLNKVFIGTSKLQINGLIKEIHSEFKNLEDVINCCEVSSHVPFISGNIGSKYKNNFHFDGGFFNFPYLSECNKRKYVLHIHPNIWKNYHKSPINFLEKISLFTTKNKNIKKMYYDGYIDTENNKNMLDKLFVRKVNFKDT